MIRSILRTSVFAIILAIISPFITGFINDIRPIVETMVENISLIFDLVNEIWDLLPNTFTTLILFIIGMELIYRYVIGRIRKGGSE